MRASRYGHGLPDDPEMHGFAAALDPEAFAHNVDGVLTRAGLRARRCSLDRFRYRRGERLVVVYRIDAYDCGSGADRPLIVAGRIHAGKKSRTEPGVHHGPSTHPRTAFLPALGMRLEIFPEDRRLPGLRMFAEQPLSQQAVDMMRAATGWSPAHADEIDVEPVRYRPGIAATLRYGPRNMTSSGHPPQCYIKLAVADGAHAPPGRAAERVNQVLERDRRSVRLSVPVAGSQGTGITAYPAAPGRSLQQIARSDGPLADAAQRAGRALAELHLVGDAALPRASGERELRKYDRAARLLEWACPDARPAIGRILSVAPAVWSAGIEGTMHGDMKPDHVFLAGEGSAVQMIDNDALSLGNPMLDIGSMLARLEALPWLEGVDELRSVMIGAQLAETYFSIVPDAWSRHVGPARSLATLLVCQHAVQRLLPGWPDRVRASLETAAARL